MDPIAILALLCALVLVILTVADINESRADDDLWFDSPPVQPIPINRGPKDAA